MRERPRQPRDREHERGKEEKELSDPKLLRHKVDDTVGVSTFFPSMRRWSVLSHRQSTETRERSGGECEVGVQRVQAIMLKEAIGLNTEMPGPCWMSSRASPPSSVHARACFFVSSASKYRRWTMSMFSYGLAWPFCGEEITRQLPRMRFDWAHCRRVVCAHPITIAGLEGLLSTF